MRSSCWADVEAAIASARGVQPPDGVSYGVGEDGAGEGRDCGQLSDCVLGVALLWLASTLENEWSRG